MEAEATQAVVETPIQTTEVQAEAPKEAPKEDPRIAERFALLAKKEKAQRERESELAKMQEEAKKAIDALKAYEDRKKNAKKDPLAYIQEAELTYDDITNHLINGNKQPAESQIEELRKDLLSTKEQLQREKETAARSTFLGQIDAHLKSNLEKYEGCNAFNVDQYMTNSIYAVIENHLVETNKMMSIDEACDLVEKYLDQEETKREEILRKTKKWGSKYGAPKTETVIEKTVPEKTTLTNAAEAPPRIEKDLTDHERRRQAAQMLNFGA